MDNDTSSGIVYAIGMGPGDPDHITLGAVKAWEACVLVFTLKPRDRESSRCRKIAEQAGLDVGKLREVAYSPSRAEVPGRWIAQQDEIRSVLEAGEAVGFATLGDPLLYSAWRSFQNTFPGKNIKIIPGIPAFLSAAADVQISIAEGDESVILAPCPDSAGKLEEILTAADTAVFYKIFNKTNSLCEWYSKNKNGFDLLWTRNTGCSEREQGLGKTISAHKGNMTTVIIKRKFQKR